MPTNKKDILQVLESNDLDAIAALAQKDRKVMSQLVRLAYDKETLVGWRAIKAIGLVAHELVKTDYDFLREMVRKLLWSLSDESGGIGWSAPEILGEIVSADPERFRDVIPLIAKVYDVEEKVFRAGVLCALGRIAETYPDFILPYKDIVIRAMSDDSALVRVYAIQLAAILKIWLSSEDLDIILKLMEKLLSDRAEVWIYKNAGFVNIQVKEAAGGIIGT